jgi:hypothetical protein
VRGVIQRDTKFLNRMRMIHVRAASTFSEGMQEPLLYGVYDRIAMCVRELVDIFAFNFALSRLGVPKEHQSIVHVVHCGWIVHEILLQH